MSSTQPAIGFVEQVFCETKPAGRPSVPEKSRRPVKPARRPSFLDSAL